jgi:tripartite ATP-independent transporter DctM subunit
MTSAVDNFAMSLPDASTKRPATNWCRPLEVLAAVLIAGIVLLLLGGVVSRYVFAQPVVWIDEVVSIAFLWFTMLGTAIAMHRNEHLRLTLVLGKLPPHVSEFVHAFALAAMAACLLTLLPPSFAYVRDEWLVTSPSLNLPGSYRVAALPFGIAAMLAMLLAYAGRTVRKGKLAVAGLVVLAVLSGLWWAAPALRSLGTLNVLIFLAGAVVLCLAAGVPIAFCFGIGALTYLGFSTHMPLQVVVGRMDEGMSSIILVSVPIFVLLGCVLDGTGMGKAIVDVLSALVGHVKAGMSYALLGSLFIVSGISGSKVSDMATVAPALFPEMKRRGHKPAAMVALLATGAAMADTVPPSIVLIVLGSVAGVSIAGLFKSGFVVAMVLLAALLILARWKARHEDTSGTRRSTAAVIGRLVLVASPALVLPFLIRGAVGEGVATATEVSTIAVLYAWLVGQLLYGGIGRRKLYGMLVETAALSGAIFLILGTASAMAWAITQSGIVQQLSTLLTSLPGGAYAFLAVTIAVFILLGCLLEGLPAVLLLAPIMFPIAKQLGIHDIHYAMVMVVAMNIGLMVPPIGIGFYVACRIGSVSPDEVMAPIWPYLIALLAGLAVIAAVPGISTVAL